MKITPHSESRLLDFITSAQNKVLIAGYGSLLSQYSRQTYSKIMGPTLPAMVNGWERSWITRSMLEAQTYAGAIPNTASMLSAQLVALEFDERFAKREQDYRFTRISPSDIVMSSSYANGMPLLRQLLDSTPIYICETLAIEPSSVQYPVSLSYVNTCLTGSYESHEQEGVQTFFDTTKGWQSSYFINDTHKHRYPRSSPVSKHDTQKWGESYECALETFKWIAGS